MTVTISIGRNIGNDRMDSLQWSRFRRKVQRVAANAGEVYFHGTGTGIYEGAREESYTVILGWAPVSWMTPEHFRRSLAILARQYGQDCIAVTEGETEFVQAAAATSEEVA